MSVVAFDGQCAFNRLAENRGSAEVGLRIRRWARLYWFRFDGEGLPVTMPAIPFTRHFRWQQIRGLQIGSWFFGAVKGAPGASWKPAVRVASERFHPEHIAERILETPAKAEERRRALFRVWADLKRQAQDSDDFETQKFVGEAYQAFMRSFLDADERAVVDLQNELAAVRAEVIQWRRGIKRSSEEP